MSGKHRGNAGGSSRARIIAAAAGVVVIGAIAATAVAMTHHGDTTRAAVTSTSTQSSSTSSSTSTTPSSSTPSSTSSTSAAAPAALLSCRDEVVAGDVLARAAAASARDWGMHTQAEVKLDDGTYTQAQTEADWAKSKARGPQDLDDFAAAQKTYQAKAGACDTVGHVDAAFARQAGDCTDRSAAVAKVASAGAKVNEQWAAHIDMMAHKAHTDSAAYHDRWMGMVQAAPSALGPFSNAKAALDKAPSCSIG